MKNFAIILKQYQRLTSLVPPLLSLAYMRDNSSSEKASRRNTLNFGFILSASFDEAAYEMDGKIYRVEVPAFVCVRPGWVCRQANPGNCEKLYFTYDKEQLRHFTFVHNCPNTILSRLYLTHQIRHSLEEIFRLAADFCAPGNVERLDLLCAQLLIETVTTQHHVQASSVLSDKKITDIAAYIDRHFANNIDMKWLIRQHGLSERTFNRRWNECFELPPHAYLIGRRINASCRLLLESDLPVYQIAARVGFCDPYYFSRIFKKYTRCSPREYRNNQ